MSRARWVKNISSEDGRRCLVAGVRSCERVGRWIRRGATRQCRVPRYPCERSMASCRRRCDHIPQSHRRSNAVLLPLLSCRAALAQDGGQTGGTSSGVTLLSSRRSYRPNELKVRWTVRFTASAGVDKGSVDDSVEGSGSQRAASPGPTTRPGGCARVDLGFYVLVSAGPQPRACAAIKPVTQRGSKRLGLKYICFVPGTQVCTL